MDMERQVAAERAEATRAAHARKVEAQMWGDDTLAVRIVRGWAWDVREYLIDAQSYSAGRLARLVGDDYGTPMFQPGGVSMPKGARP
jgi:hypothetical protein